MVDVSLIVIVLLVLVLVIGVILYFRRSGQSNSPEMLEYLKQTMQTVHETNRRYDELTHMVSKQLADQSTGFFSTLQKNSADMNQRLDKAAEVIGAVQKNIGELSEVGRSIKDLQDYLRSPKLRGNIGEHILVEALRQLLPRELYEIQYTFPSGETVDAIIKIGDMYIPIDSKFPMENFTKMNKTQAGEKKQAEKQFFTDVRKHITDIARKYISANAKTVNYALMYVPSESIYYEIIQHEDVFTLSRDKSVLLVSPMSFNAFLRAVLMSLQGIRVQKKAREILSILESTRKEYEKIDEALGVLEKHFGNAYNQLQNVNKFFMRLGTKLEQTKHVELPMNEEIEKES